MFNILLHDRFLRRARKTCRRYRELKKQLKDALDGLQKGPSSSHIQMRHIASPKARGNTHRMRVGKHRMIYRVFEQERLIIPLFLSDRPRNEATYRDWEGSTQAIFTDYESQNHDSFTLWQGEIYPPIRASHALV